MPDENKERLDALLQALRAKNIHVEWQEEIQTAEDEVQLARWCVELPMIGIHDWQPGRTEEEFLCSKTGARAKWGMHQGERGWFVYIPEDEQKPPKNVPPGRIILQVPPFDHLATDGDMPSVEVARLFVNGKTKEDVMVLGADQLTTEGWGTLAASLLQQVVMARVQRLEHQVGKESMDSAYVVRQLRDRIGKAFHSAWVTLGVE